MGVSPNGILFLDIFESALLTVPATLILIFFYRRAVTRAMLASSPSAGSTLLSEIPAAPATPAGSPGLTQAERRSRLRLSVIYSLAGLAAALFWTFLFFASEGPEFAPFRGFVVWYGFCWPVPLTLITLFNLPRRQSLLIVAGYVLAGALGVFLWSTIPHAISGQPGMQAMSNVESFFTFLVLQMVTGIIIAIATGGRIRGVSPFAMAVLLVFAVSSFAATQTFVTLLEVETLRAPLLKLGRHGLWMLLSLPVGYLAWRLVLWLNTGYTRKTFSDVQLVTDAFWILMALIITAAQPSWSGWRSALPLLGFFIYRSLAQLGLKLWASPQAPGRRLLLLRVFGFRRRTEKLFDAVGERWRFRGEVMMIAGTDLASRTMILDDTLAFLSGDFQTRFVAGEGDLEQHLQRVDKARDPDGRFRLSQFFCHANTWTGTLTALAGRSDVILMDLRGFSERNSGCVFELRQLAAQQRLALTLFIVDRSTDIKLLESTVGSGMPKLNLHFVQGNASAAGGKVYRSLCLL